MLHAALSKFRLFDEGLPPIGKRSVCLSTAHINMDPNRGGKEAKLRKDSIDFGLHSVDLSKLKDSFSYILKKCSSYKLNWYNESSIKSFCSHVLEDAFDCLSLNSSLSISSVLSIMGEKSNLCILKNDAVPICLIEIKHPSEKDVMNNTWVFGQVHGYLQLMKNFYGIQHPIVLLSTYTQWRVFLLENNGFFNADEKLEAIMVSNLNMPLNLDLSDYLV